MAHKTKDAVGLSRDSNNYKQLEKPTGSIQVMEKSPGSMMMLEISHSLLIVHTIQSSFALLRDDAEGALEYEDPVGLFRDSSNYKHLEKPTGSTQVMEKSPDSMMMLELSLSLLIVYTIQSSCALLRDDAEGAFEYEDPVCLFRDSSNYKQLEKTTGSIQVMEKSPDSMMMLEISQSLITVIT